MPENVIEIQQKSTVKLVFQFLSSVVLYTIISILVLVFIMFIMYFVDQQIGRSKSENRSPLFGAYIIISDSMVPRINVYDAVITARVSEKNIKVGDIITFISKEIDTKGTPITHRVAGIVYDETKKNVLGYRTKGDHNNTEDFALIKPNEVLGKVYLRIPFVGYLQMILTNPIGWIILIVVPCLLLIGSDVIKIFRTVKEQ